MPTHQVLTQPPTSCSLASHAFLTSQEEAPGTPLPVFTRERMLSDHCVRGPTLIPGSWNACAGEAGSGEQFFLYIQMSF